MLIETVNLIKKIRRSGMILFFILFFALEMSSQLNSEVGYTFSYLPLKTTNSIINLYNNGNNLAENETVLSPMGTLKLLHGFNIGLAYRVGTLKFGAFWNSLSANRSGTVGNVKEGIGREKNFYFNTNTFSFGMEAIVGHIGIGGTIDYNSSALKTKLKNISSKVLISQGTKYTYYSNKVYLILYFRATDSFGVELKPYVSFPWERIDVSDLANLLDVGGDSSFDREKVMQFGLTFSIINGFQPDF